MLRTVRLLPHKGFRRWASTPGVSPRHRQPATGPPGSYPDRTSTGKQRRARLVINRLHDQPPVTGRTAENIKQRLTQFLRDELKLELSQEKTLITHARPQAARFLGYDISAYHGHTKLSHGRRLTGGFIQLKVPRAVIKAKTTQSFRRGKAAQRSGRVNQDDYAIVATCGAEYRGLVQYYLLAGNVYWFNRVEWAMSSSMLKTLASK